MTSIPNVRIRNAFTKRIGVIYGHQSIPAGDLDSLSAIARQMDVDVLISGHTHVFQATEYDNKFFLNPGTATGAWSGTLTDDPPPSFALMDIQGTVIVTYLYQLHEGEVRVEKIEWRREVPPAPVVASPTPKTGALPTSIPSSPAPTQQSVWS